MRFAMPLAVEELLAEQLQNVLVLFVEVFVRRALAAERLAIGQHQIPPGLRAQRLAIESHELGRARRSGRRAWLLDRDASR